MTTALDDVRFHAHRYSVPETANYMGVAYPTMYKWVAGHSFDVRDKPVTGAPILKSNRDGREYRLAFAALVEAQIIAGLRRAAHGCRCSHFAGSCGSFATRSARNGLWPAIASTSLVPRSSGTC